MCAASVNCTQVVELFLSVPGIDVNQQTAVSLAIDLIYIHVAVAVICYYLLLRIMLL